MQPKRSLRSSSDSRRRGTESAVSRRRSGDATGRSRDVAPSPLKPSRHSVTGPTRPARRAKEEPLTVQRSKTFADNPFSKSKKTESLSRSTQVPKRETPPRRKNKKEKQTYSGFKRDERNVRAKERLIKQIGSILLVVLLIGLFVWGAVALVNSSLFSIDEVIITGNKSVSSDSITILSSVPTSTTTTVLADKKTIPGEIPKHPWIKSLEVKKSLPHTIEIIVKERTPRAIVSVPQNGQWLIASDGVWLDKLAEDKLSTISSTNPHYEVFVDATAFPIIEDMPLTTPKEGSRTSSKEVLNALSVLSEISPELRGRITKLQAVSVPKTKLFTIDGVEIAFGSAEQASTKDRIARSILETQKGKVVLINVRTPDKPTWRGLLTE